MDLKEQERVVRNRDRWQAVVNTVMNLRVLQNAVSFLTSLLTISVQIQALWVVTSCRLSYHRSSAKIKNMWMFTATHPYVVMV